MNHGGVWCWTEIKRDKGKTSESCSMCIANLQVEGKEVVEESEKGLRYEYNENKKKNLRHSQAEKQKSGKNLQKVKKRHHWEVPPAHADLALKRLTKV